MPKPDFVKLATSFDEDGVLDCEVGRWDVYEYPKNNPNAMSQSALQKHSGTRSNRVLLRQSDSQAEWGNKRCELNFNKNNDPNIRWHRFYIYYPSATYRRDREEEINAQWHDESDNCSTSPALALETRDSRWRIARRFATSNYCNSANRRGPYYTDLGAERA